MDGDGSMVSSARLSWVDGVWAAGPAPPQVSINERLIFFSALLPEFSGKITG